MAEDGKRDKRRNSGEPGNVVSFSELFRRRAEKEEQELESEEIGGEAAFEQAERGKADSKKRPGSHGGTRKKEKSTGTLVGDIALILFMLVICAAAAVLIITSLSNVKTIRIEGNRLTEAEPILEWYFPDEKSRILSRLIIRNYLGRTNPPAFTSSKVTVTGLTECVLTVGEKDPLFTISVSDEDGVLILTEDGAELVKTMETPAHIPHISGIHAMKDMPLLQPETDQPATFEALVRVLRILREYEVESDEIFIKNGQFYLRFGLVNVNLGKDVYLKEKVIVLKSQVPQFEGLRGTLHLENYDGSEAEERFTFEVDP